MSVPSDQTLKYLLGRAFVTPLLSCESTSCFHENGL